MGGALFFCKRREEPQRPLICISSQVVSENQTPALSGISRRKAPAMHRFTSAHWQQPQYHTKQIYGFVCSLYKSHFLCRRERERWCVPKGHTWGRRVKYTADGRTADRSHGHHSGLSLCSSLADFLEHGWGQAIRLIDRVIKAQVAAAEAVLHGASAERGRGRQWPWGDGRAKPRGHRALGWGEGVGAWTRSVEPQARTAAGKSIREERKNKCP